MNLFLGALNLREIKVLGKSLNKPVFELLLCIIEHGNAEIAETGYIEAIKAEEILVYGIRLAYVAIVGHNYVFCVFNELTSQ